MKQMKKKLKDSIMITLTDMDFGTWPMITDFDRFFPVESESGNKIRELALVCENNRVKMTKNVFLAIFEDV